MFANIAPLKSSMMAAGIIGFLVSAFYLYPISNTWGFTFGLFFALLFIASVISMTYGPIVMDIKRRK
ncbi:hypothetical protein HYU13_03040 [Candidatus Woesearchaeota archaeon]|nr:hypothetical protein [Candidatus Woesearchaeota archaeon]